MATRTRQRGSRAEQSSAIHKAAIELEADPRHAELVIRELGLEDTKSSKVSGAKVSGKLAGMDDKTSDEESKELGVEDARKYR